jgi:uroporphyrinogen-III synthase
MRILIPRAAGLGGTLADAVRARGHVAVEVPMMELVYDLDAVRIALANHPEATLVLTSPAAASAVVAALGDGHHRGPIVAVGPGTAARMPPSATALVGAATARALAELLPQRPGQVVLWPRAEDPTPGTREALAARGPLVEVVAYHNHAPPDLPGSLAAAAPIDLVVVTAASIARRLASAWSAGPPPPIVSMGPSTSEAAREVGLRVVGEAAPPGVDGVVRALDDWLVTVGGSERTGVPLDRRSS